MPVISVIVPVYKVEQYLSDCIDSILAQTFTDFELILVDDGSPDHCGTICDNYQKMDNRIVVLHKENGGLSDARNKGIDIAKGKYLTFIDSDDLVHKDYLDALLSALKKTDADISCCSMEEFMDGSNCDLDGQISNPDKYTVFSGREACEHIYLMDGQITVNAWGKLYSSHLFETLRFPFGKINEDQGTTPIALYNSSTVVTTNDKLYKYRVRESSIMHQKFNSKRFDDLFCTQLCIDFFKEVNDQELVKLSEKYKDVIHARLILESIQSNCKSTISKEYDMSELHAIYLLQRNLDYQKFTWYLSKIHPEWIVPYQYLYRLFTYIQKPFKVLSSRKNNHG